MAYPVAATHPSYSGTYIPSMWSGRLLDEFYKATVFAEIAK